MSFPQTSDGALLRRYLDEHSQEAFTQVVERHARVVHRACLRQLGGHVSLAEDAAQATFVLLAHKASDLLTHPSVAAWLQRSARYIAANLRRQEARRSAQTLIEAELAVAPPTAEADEQGLVHLRTLLNDALAHLPDTTRAAVILYHLEGRPQREIADSLGLSEPAVKKRIQYGVKRLRERLSRHVHTVRRQRTGIF